LVTCSEGDLRKAITYLQCAARLKPDNVIKSSDILEIAGVLNERVIDKIMDTCLTGSFEKVEACVQELIYDGFSCNQILTQLHDVLIERADLSDAKKAIIFEKIAKIDNNLMEGADEYLQILDLLVVIMKQMK
jgi:replication factor C subunit 2/4